MPPVFAVMLTTPLAALAMQLAAPALTRIAPCAAPGKRRTTADAFAALLVERRFLHPDLSPKNLLVRAGAAERTANAAAVAPIVLVDLDPAMTRLGAEFAKRGVKVIGLSIDPLDAHRRVGIGR